MNRIDASHLLAVLIGGIDSDPTPARSRWTAARNEGNSGLYRFAGDIAGREQVLPEYFNWNGTRAGKIRVEKRPRVARASPGTSVSICRHFPATAWRSSGTVGEGTPHSKSCNNS